MASVTRSERVEAAARALIRHRLARHHVPASLTAIVAESARRVEDQMWPTLLDEARAVVDALDRI